MKNKHFKALSLFLCLLMIAGATASGKLVYLSYGNFNYDVLTLSVGDGDGDSGSFDDLFSQG